MADFRFLIEFVDPALIPGPTPETFTPWTVLWRPDADADQAAHEAARARNLRREAALAAVLPGLAPVPRDTLDVEDFDLLRGDGVPAAAALRRDERRRLGAAPAADPALGAARVDIFDGAVILEVAAPQTPRVDRPALAAALDRLAAGVAAATGMAAWDPKARRPFAAGELGAALVARFGPTLDRLATARRRDALRRRLGPAAFGVVTLAAAGAIAALAGLGLADGRRATAADRQAPATFVTLGPVGGPAAGLLPDYRLAGEIEGSGERAVVAASRAEAVRAAPGARFTVLPTGDPAEPWVMRSRVDRIGLVVPLGPLGATPAAALLLTGGVAAVWGIAVLRPALAARRAPARWVAVTENAVRLLGLAAVAALGLAASLLATRAGLL